MKLVISIIIVHYQVKQELFACLRSIYSSKPKVPFEIIVVDNDEIKTIEKTLKKKFPQVSYINNPVNNGWGGGVNIGSTRASGEYIYLLNPDTTVFPGAIDAVYQFFRQHKNVGVASSLLLDLKKIPYQLQGTAMLTPLRAIIVYSFINKLFPTNPISKHFWLKSWDKKHPRQTDVAPLTAALVKKSIFEKAGRFDESFFLYFEEYDFAKKMKRLGVENYILPDSQVIHAWGVSSQTRKDISAVFAASRFTYFKKYYGFLTAKIVEAFLGLRKMHLLLGSILLIGMFLRLFRLNELMIFIGDQAWFYLSARDMLASGHIPLVGITSSHTWLHQGPLWTYLMSPILLLFYFNPLSVGYFVALLDVVTIWLLFIVARKMFSERVGLIAAALYATSPLVVIHARMPYHTTPLVFLTLVFLLSIYQWLSGNKRYFPLVLFFLGLLYNFELNTILLWMILGLLIIIGLICKTPWITILNNKKIMALSLLGLFIPMIPILVYDTSHGFVQTLRFGLWIIYTILKSVGFFGSSLPIDHTNFWIDSWTYLQRFLFGYNGIVALIVFIAGCIVYFIYFGFELGNRVYRKNDITLVLLTTLSLAGYFVVRTASEAYLPVLFPGVLLLIAQAFDIFLSKKQISYVITLAICIIIIFNSLYLLNNNFLIGTPHGYGPSYTQRLQISKEIVARVGKRKYNLIGRGYGSQFPNYTSNYQYLTWWLGNEPVKEKQSIIFTIQDTDTNVSVNEMK